MITAINTATAWVLDQDSAKKFFTDTLGLEVRADITMGPGMRWLTVGAPNQPDTQLTLMVPGPPSLDPESAEQLTTLIAKGVLIGCTFTVTDCHTTYKELTTRGVTFLHEPQPRPWGLSATFRDDSGSWYEILQPTR
ncbi:VOC family protein [Nocardia terpenica]|uniref:Glyoxalase n=1 Tax=Nocardia terpenica TaxID=455432 RepID=A0A161Z5A4_9NOCA|nr:VOC family protein [Nocardia terpenica]KZM74994.1 glyoxalase [Nocardia terpenica]MBF6065156.1 VOC family protein [Nocardia terpenica]MBF6107884.1 VOC family protein [Nocardia terpenica]MBF6115585.1 VOC family protein [Nocardia terpenica]MBF6122023.1 VOC family protein [Nocardia terpenica]